MDTPKTPDDTLNGWPTEAIAHTIHAAGDPDDPKRPRTVRAQLDRLPLQTLRLIAGRTRSRLPRLSSRASLLAMMGSTSKQALLVAFNAFAFWLAIQDEAEQALRAREAKAKEDDQLKPCHRWPGRSGARQCPKTSTRRATPHPPATTTPTPRRKANRCARGRLCVPSSSPPTFKK